MGWLWKDDTVILRERISKLRSDLCFCAIERDNARALVEDQRDWILRLKNKEQAQVDEALSLQADNMELLLENQRLKALNEEIMADAVGVVARKFAAWAARKEGAE